MRAMRIERRTVLWTIGIAALVNVGVGFLFAYPAASGGGVGVLVYVAWRLVCSRSKRWKKNSKNNKKNTNTDAAETSPVHVGAHEPVDPNDTDALFRQMLAQGRSALLLRPQVAENLSSEQRLGAKEALFEAMTVVPDGEVVLGQIDDALDDGKLDYEELAEFEGRVVRVEHFLLDRYLVTNRQFERFVAGGGYEQVTLWDEAIWPAVLDFVDQTGQPGPRYWHDGRFEPGRADHPVIGVSWFEASAYACWLGKRLPTGAEWVKAGSWPVKLASARVQRRYPWGETMDRGRANLWGSGPGDTVAVDQLADGVSVGGVYQLIGNVWEWTGGDFRGEGHGQGPLIPDVLLKSIRGGAFDTYFDNQATCHFQSGEAAIARKHNIGFRCAVGVCDLTLADVAQQRAESEELEAAAAEEVQV